MHVMLTAEVHGFISGLNDQQKAAALEALVALAGASTNQLQQVGNPLHLEWRRAIIRRGIVVIFHFNSAHPRRAKKIHSIRPAHAEEPNDFGML
jgi:hypothetical protein